MNQINDIIELGNQDKYIVQDITKTDDGAVLHCAKLKLDGTPSKHFMGTLSESYGETKLIRTYKG